jgi:[NiFe] hydrogenase diaphorase moiety small subunit
MDGEMIEAQAGQTILQAADNAGKYIPRLCAHPELAPHGSCRVCTVLVNGRTQAACTQPVSDGMIIENDTEKVNRLRAQIIEMLFIEGNHFCMFCEKSGNCELQALAYRFGITSFRYPLLFPHREVDASHPDIMIDHNRCILCARCVRASRDIDGKHIFDFVGRGLTKSLAVDASTDLKATNADARDRAISMCPVGAILPKHAGYRVPVGQRIFDSKPIGSAATPDQPTTTHKE